MNLLHTSVRALNLIKLRCNQQKWSIKIGIAVSRYLKKVFKFNKLFIENHRNKMKGFEVTFIY